MNPQLIDVRALTLRNPWAHLIAHGGKDIENRTWMPPESVASRLLIHAGKGWDDVPGVQVAGLQTSAIVAVVDIMWACNTSLHSDTLRCSCNPDWAQPGQCHWVIKLIHALAEPVPAVGRQGLWRPDAATVDAVRAQLEAAAR